MGKKQVRKSESEKVVGGEKRHEQEPDEWMRKERMRRKKRSEALFIYCSSGEERGAL